MRCLSSSRRSSSLGVRRSCLSQPFRLLSGGGVAFPGSRLAARPRAAIVDPHRGSAMIRRPWESRRGDRGQPRSSVLGRAPLPSRRTSPGGTVEPWCRSARPPLRGLNPIVGGRLRPRPEGLGSVWVAPPALPVGRHLGGDDGAVGRLPLSIPFGDLRSGAEVGGFEGSTVSAPGCSRWRGQAVGQDAAFGVAASVRRGVTARAGRPFARRGRGPPVSAHRRRELRRVRRGGTTTAARGRAVRRAPGQGTPTRWEAR